jgi:hypothetical protein
MVRRTRTVASSPLTPAFCAQQNRVSMREERDRRRREAMERRAERRRQAQEVPAEESTAWTDLMEKMEVVRIDSAMYQSSDDVCSICLDSYGETAARLPCGHFYHEHCIMTWVSSGQGSCPICRSTASHNTRHRPVQSAAPPPATAASSSIVVFHL